MKRAFWLGLLAGPALVATALAQVPPPPAVAVVPAVPVAPAAPPRNIWGFISRTPEQKAQCKDAFCQSAVGKMVNGAAGPVSAMSGGLIQNRCAARAIEDAIKNKQEGGAENIAGKIKKDEAEAKARREAVRYLGTVDCNRFPDARDVLIASLLEDRNECVRFEAALALQSGCCCNKEVVKALADCITGKSRVVETSERVKAAAAEALSRCEVAATIIPVEEKLQVEPLLKKVELSPMERDKRIRELAQAEIMEEARQALAEFRAKPPASAIPSPTAGPARPASVAAILANTFSPGARSTSAAPVETAAQPSAEPPTEPKVVNAVLTSQPKTTEPSAPPTASTVAPAATTGTSERRSFIDGLTHALKGKQGGRKELAPVQHSEPTSAAPTLAPPESQARPGSLSHDLDPAVGRPLPLGEAAPPSSPATAPVLPGLPGPLVPIPPMLPGAPGPLLPARQP